MVEVEEVFEKESALLVWLEYVKGAELKQIAKWFRLDKKYLRLYVIICFFSFLYVFPIMLANVYYFDDMARVYYGASSWNGDGRPLAEQLMLVLCGGLPITDLAPLPLVMAVLALTYTLVVYIRENLDSFLGSPILILVILSVITNPFSMSNLSYRFDCVFMFMALGIPFLVFSLPRKISLIMCFFVSCIACLFMMSMYQPVLGMCCVLFIISFVISLIGNKKEDFSIKWELCRICGIGMGAVLYKCIIANWFINESTGGWKYTASQIVKIDGELLGSISRNIMEFCRYVRDYFLQISRLNKYALVFVVVLSFLAGLFQFIRKRKIGGGHVCGSCFDLRSAGSSFYRNLSASINIGQSLCKKQGFYIFWRFPFLHRNITITFAQNMQENSLNCVCGLYFVPLYIYVYIWQCS